MYGRTSDASDGVGFNSLMATSIHALRFFDAILYRFSFRVDVYLHFFTSPFLGMDAKNPGLVAESLVLVANK